MVLFPLLGSRFRGGRAAALVLTASLGVQTSALLATDLFARVGPMGVSGVRFAIAAVLVCALVRPRLGGRSVRAWSAIVLFGTSIATMNLFLYLALERLPFGVALTLEFLGPFAVAVVAARRPVAALFSVAGLVGVILVVRPAATSTPSASCSVWPPPSRSPDTPCWPSGSDGWSGASTAWRSPSSWRRSSPLPSRSSSHPA